MAMTEGESLVMRYFHARHSRDFDAMRECLADDAHLDLGNAPAFPSADSLTEFWRHAPRLRDVTLLDSVVTDNGAALLFEGNSTADGARLRIGEFLRIAAGRIRHISMAIVPLEAVSDSLTPPPTAPRAREPITTLPWSSEPQH